MPRVLWLVALVSCYEAPVDLCGIRCTDSCPGDLVCMPDHVCRAADGTCDAATIDFATIGVGARHVCGLDVAGTIWCWGDNDDGQLGNMATPNATVPTQVGAPGITWTALAVGAEHTCGIHDGEIECWGQNQDGQVVGPQGNVYTMPTPVTFATATTPPLFDHVAAGGSHTCALASGTLWCWGTNPQTGTGAATVTVATQVGTLADWTQISTGSTHSCGISASMGVMCWGDNSSHECGADTPAVIDQPAQVAMPSGLTATTVVAGSAVSCAIVSDGSLWCWGFNSGGIIDASGTAPSIPTQIGGEGGWSAISISAYRACGVRSGMAYCWGTSQASVGGLGDGRWAAYMVPPASAEQIGPADDISIGLDAIHYDETDELGCLRVGNAGSCWGDNQHGTLGIGSSTNHPVPVEISAPAGLTWKHASAGRYHTCAQASDGTLWCWGANYEGQIDATTSPRGETTPCVEGQPCDESLPVNGPAGLSPFDDLVTGDDYSCTRNGSAIHCWGAGDNLGVDQPQGITTVVPTAPATGGWTALLGGDRATCGIAGNGELECWGFVDGYLLPPGPNDGMDPELHDLTSLSFGDTATCGARSSDRARVCFGANGDGQVGDGTDVDVATPTAYDAGTIAGVSFRGAHGCAVTTAGGVVCWGDNYSGEVGVNGVFAVETPTPVSNTNGLLAGCTVTAVGAEFSCAICNGQVWCWGDGSASETGARTVMARYVADFVGLPLDHTFVEISAGATHACALDDGGRLYCWGNGPHGQIGDGGHAVAFPTPVGPP